VEGDEAGQRDSYWQQERLGVREQRQRLQSSGCWVLCPGLEVRAGLWEMWWKQSRVEQLGLTG